MTAPELRVFRHYLETGDPPSQSELLERLQAARDGAQAPAPEAA
jgi:hypothetical protein